MKAFMLSNGVTIPSVGFGTWQIPEEDVYEAVLHALEAGYRHIDTAMAYRNEHGVGKAIKDSKIPREELFITTKLPAEIKGYKETIEAFNQSLQQLDVDYVDLYLIHAPKPWGNDGDGMDFMEANIASWKAFEELYRADKIRSIGVSNFNPDHLGALIAATTLVPMVNQIQVNPNHIPRDTIEYCHDHNILIEAYSPLATGRIFGKQELQTIADKYNKTVAQLCIRWAFQLGLLPLPKSVTPSRIKENFDIFDFNISKEDMDKIGKL